MWWDGSRLVPRRCSEPLWLKVQGKANWSYALTARLRSTIDSAAFYRVRSPATDIVGNRETAFEADRNSIIFEIE